MREREGPCFGFRCQGFELRVSGIWSRASGCGFRVLVPVEHAVAVEVQPLEEPLHFARKLLREDQKRKVRSEPHHTCIARRRRAWHRSRGVWHHLRREGAAGVLPG